MSEDEDIGFQKRGASQPPEGPKFGDSRPQVQPPLDINSANPNNNSQQPGLGPLPSQRTDTRPNEPDKQDQKEGEDEPQNMVHASYAA